MQTTLTTILAWLLGLGSWWFAPEPIDYYDPPIRVSGIEDPDWMDADERIPTRNDSRWHPVPLAVP